MIDSMHMMKAIASLVVSMLLWQGVAEGAETKGVVIYQSNPKNSADLAKVREFTSYKAIGHVVYIQPVGKRDEIRTFRLNVVEVINYPNLDAMTIVTPQEIESLNDLILRMKQVIQKYRAARSVISYQLAELSAVQQMLKQGDIMVAGQWKLKSKRAMVIAEGQVLLPHLTIGKKQYTNVRLTSVVGSKVKFIHSAGVVSIDTTDLSSEVISKLNRTSEKVQIPKNED